MDLWPLVDELPTPSNFSAAFGYILQNNTDATQFELFKGFSSVLLNFASICCVLFMCVGIPGNLITIIALARCKKVRNATAVFIINLSCSDLLFCCFNLPLAASTFYHRQWIHGDIMCRLFPLLRYGLLAVSLFTILAITINRYIMIGHPRIYPRIYRRRYLIIMVAATWMAAFSSLIPTWNGTWGKFGLDYHIGSCSILPATNGSSPKEFLFVAAFLLPCLCIMCCYARIFYIVRKTAMKTHEIQQKPNGSIRMSHNHGATNNNNGVTRIPQIPSLMRQTSKESNKNGEHRHRLSFQDDCDNFSERSRNSQNSNGQKVRNYLSKTKEEDLKFIDTSVESDLPPTLSKLQRKSVQISIEHQTFLSSPSSLTPTTVETATTTIASLDNEQLNSISRDVDGLNVGTTQGINNSHDYRDLPVDSAVEDSTTISLDQVYNNDEQQNNIANHLLSIPEPSSSSGIELPYDQETPQKKPKRFLKSALNYSTKIKQKKLKDENPVKDRKKSLANTSGASILYAGRMSAKDRRLLKMILVIFISFLTCYLPITLTKVLRSIADINFVFIMGYLLVYLTTCINPIIYVVMSSEYRQAYKNLLMCRTNNSRGGCNAANAKYRESRRKT